MILPFSLRELQYFVTVVAEGQITQAAAKLHVAQPALSKTIAKLEASMKISLLERQARGVRPTEAGAVFYEKASLVVAAAEDAATALGPWVRAEQAVVLGCFPSIQGFSRPILRRYMETHPQVEVEVRHLPLARRVIELKNGAIDAELLYPPTPDPALVIETVACSPRYVLLPERHRLGKESSLVFEQIADETFPGRHPSVSEQWAEEAWLSRHRGSNPPVTVEAPVTLDALWALVYSGKAIAVLPKFMVESSEGDGVRAVPLVDVPPLEIGLARRKRDTRAVVTDMFDVARSLDLGAST
jgi:DNA-binding transcriptional LysR family regulator